VPVGLGHLAIQYARVTGAAVIAVDINDARLQEARELGAEHCPRRHARLRRALGRQRDQVPIFETVLGGITIKGSIVGTHRDLEEVIELHRRGLTRVMRAECELDDVNEAIEQVLDGSAPSPLMVFRMPGVRAATLDGRRAAAGV
jgi:alcohol dehydrogenase, propanol-preferring